MPNILGIDDDPSICMLVTDVLGLEECDVRTAEDDFAGLCLIEEQRPDCVVLDVMMPGMDGHAVLQHPAQPSPAHRSAAQRTQRDRKSVV